jgi:C-terminal processing protease CtpA/Prc
LLSVRTALQSALQARSVLPSTSSSTAIALAKQAEIAARQEMERDGDPLIRDNPAYLAGVRINDVIMSVNNTDARTSSFEQVLKALGGKVRHGNVVVVIIVR